MSRARLKLTRTDEQVLRMLRSHRWPNGVICPFCRSQKIIHYGRASNRPYVQRYRCKSCGRQSNDLTGTPLA